MMRRLSLERKTHEHGAYDGINILQYVRDVLFVLLFWSLTITAAWLTYSGNRQVIGKPYYERSVDKKRGWFGGCLFCFVSRIR